MILNGSNFVTFKSESSKFYIFKNKLIKIRITILIMQLANLCFCNLNQYEQSIRTVKTLLLILTNIIEVHIFLKYFYHDLTVNLNFIYTKSYINFNIFFYISNSNYKFRILYKYLIGQTQESILEYDLL